MDFQEILKKNHPDLYRRQFTPQYKLSEKILDYLMSYRLTQPQMADMFDLDLETYLKMEFGEDSISVDRYEAAIRLFEERVGN